MDPTFLYNNYHVERRKIYEDNPRSNLKSSLQLSWADSLNLDLSPKEKIQRRREQERRLIGERNNDLIAQRLARQIGLQPQSAKKGSTFSVDVNRRSKPTPISIYQESKRQLTNIQSNYLDNDSLKEQVQLYNSTKLKTIDVEGMGVKGFNGDRYGGRQIILDKEINYRLQNTNPRSRFSHHSSIASNQIIGLTNSNNFLSSYLNHRLEGYLNSNNNKQDSELNRSRLSQHNMGRMD